MIGKFFHTPKARRFNIPYRFYDPDKEAMQEREERIKKELGIGEKKAWDPNYRPNIRGQFRRSMSSAGSGDAQKRSATRLILLIIILGVVFYFLLNF